VVPGDPGVGSGVLAETDGCLSDLDITIDAAAHVGLLQNRGISVMAVG
jgi:hypothetical protein